MSNSNDVPTHPMPITLSGATAFAAGGFAITVPAIIHKKETERLSTIIAMQQIIATSTLSRVELMNLIAERVQLLTQAEGAAFELHEDDDMVYRACSGSTTPFLGMRLSIHKSISGQSVLTRQILRCDDSETDSRVDREACRRVGARSMVVVPLLYGEKVVGVLKVLSGQPDFFTDRDVQTLELMAGLFGAVVNQAEIFDAQQEALLESEYQHRSLFETTTQGVVYHDATGRIIAANPAAEQMLGLSEDQMRGIAAADPRWHLLNGDGSPCPDEDVPALFALSTGQEVRGRIVGVRDAQTEGHRWLCVDCVPQFRQGDPAPYQIYSLFTDVTAQREMEVQREKHQREVESLNISLRRAMVETHHRVKNNLQTLLAMMDLDTAEDTAAAPSGTLLRLSANVQLLALIHDILTQQSKSDWQGNQLSTRSLLGNLLGLLRQTICPELHWSELAEVSLSLERGTALALLTNELVQNAVKHGKGRVEVALCAERDGLHFTVADDGKGFPADFDPRKAARTGLELAMTLASHDLAGTITFGSRPESGGLVTVVFSDRETPSSFF